MNSVSDNFNMEEFLCIKDQSYFNRDKTLALIDYYKSLKPKVSTGAIKSMKRLWDIIGREMSNKFKITVSASKCENKFKVFLERTYKKIVDNNNKTGRGRKTFEYEAEMAEIFSKKANVKPVLLLSNTTVVSERAQATHIDTSPAVSEAREDTLCEDIADKQGTSSETRSVSAVVNTPTSGRKKRPRSNVPYNKRNEILSDIKNDLKKYYEEKLKIDKEKLSIAQEKLEDRKNRTEILKIGLNITKIAPIYYD